MKFLFYYKIISALVIGFAMMFKIFFYHLVRYISRTPCSISYSPKMPTIISLPKFRIFFLKSARTPTLQSLYQITDRFRRWILYMDVNVIFTDYTLKNFYIFRFTYLTNQISTSFLNITFQNMVAIFCNPNYMHCQPSYSMPSSSLFLTHKVKLQKCVATESLALKVHSFN